MTSQLCPGGLPPLQAASQPEAHEAEPRTLRASIANSRLTSWPIWSPPTAFMLYRYVAATKPVSRPARAQLGMSFLGCGRAPGIPWGMLRSWASPCTLVLSG